MRPCATVRLGTGWLEVQAFGPNASETVAAALQAAALFADAPRIDGSKPLPQGSSRDPGVSGRLCVTGDLTAAHYGALAALAKAGCDVAVSPWSGNLSFLEIAHRAVEAAFHRRHLDPRTNREELRDALVQFQFVSATLEQAERWADVQASDDPPDEVAPPLQQMAMWAKYASGFEEQPYRLPWGQEISLPLRGPAAFEAFRKLLKAAKIPPSGKRRTTRLPMTPRVACNAVFVFALWRILLAVGRHPRNDDGTPASRNVDAIACLLDQLQVFGSGPDNIAILRRRGNDLCRAAAQAQHSDFAGALGQYRKRLQRR